MQRVAGIGFVIVLHIGVIYVLSAGLSKSVVEILKGPIEASVIEELEEQKEEEPPPPPPKFEQPPPPFVPPPEIAIDIPVESSTSTAITQVTTQVRPPAPPPAPVAKPGPTPPRADPKRPNSRPDYPPTSRRLGEEGSVILALYVAEDGKVKEAKVHEPSGFPKLDEAAVREALRRWRFIPATLEGKNVAAWHQVKVTFRLTEDGD
ncbi:MAG: energy transducer TonB [Gammaproteobacteria bacterium]|nr:energy transducer TonB [Gammaproteobacteria bacterium]